MKTGIELVADEVLAWDMRMAEAARDMCFGTQDPLLIQAADRSKMYQRDGNNLGPVCFAERGEDQDVFVDTLKEAVSDLCGTTLDGRIILRLSRNLAKPAPTPRRGFSRTPLLSHLSPTRT